MQFLDLTLPTPQENLALDEALLVTAEADGRAEYLRVWESPTYFVVLGRNCRVEDDVFVENCRADGVPILRRVSGGGTVLLGPGCLNFALVLRFGRDRRLIGVAESFDLVLGRVLTATRSIDANANRAGPSDLVVGDRKFSGNSQRRQRTHLLHHGTVLYSFDCKAIARYLREPPRQPAHRKHREHQSFVGNLATDMRSLVERLRDAWHAIDFAPDWPRPLVERLIRQKYESLTFDRESLGSPEHIR